MLLSIIIVNYNVKYFLEHCLFSVKKAISNIEAEVWVIDNNSSDGSISYLKSKFPFVYFIENYKNIGFSKANNQALSLAKGKLVLFLNPDTIIPENCFELLIKFLSNTKDAGAIGVRMIDGKGKFLKESKRGFPTLWPSFTKLSGLTQLFPYSRFFSKYYLGYLPEYKTHEIDVVSGAFLLASKEVLNLTNGFDEQFFMYAEDIDLSYRIQKAGFKNYYFPDVTIIHFKGESTRKNTKYVKLFYKAMIQFVKKYNGNKYFNFLSLIINTGIIIREGIEIVRRLVKNKAMPYYITEQILEAELIGDKNSSDEIKSIVHQSEHASCIIFCEGETFSFQNIIKSVQHYKHKRMMIHAKTSRSIVGSYDKDQQGNAIAF